jgi:hypothetical protein
MFESIGIAPRIESSAFLDSPFDSDAERSSLSIENGAHDFI